MQFDEYQCYVKQLMNKNIVPDVYSKKELELMLVELTYSAIKIGVNLEKIAENSIDELVRERYD